MGFYSRWGSIITILIFDWGFQRVRLYSRLRLHSQADTVPNYFNLHANNFRGLLIEARPSCAKLQGVRVSQGMYHLNNYLPLHVSLSAFPSIHLSVTLVFYQFQRVYDKMSLIKNVWYVLRARNMYLESASDPLGQPLGVNLKAHGIKKFFL